MKIEHIINAWRDEEYRESLDAELRAALPEHPAGAIDLLESELASANGGSWDLIFPLLEVLADTAGAEPYTSNPDPSLTFCMGL